MRDRATQEPKPEMGRMGVKDPVGPPAASLELEDVQGLVLRGYGSLRAARYLLLRVGEAAGARAWLRALADGVTTAQRSPDGTHPTESAPHHRDSVGTPGTA